MKTLDYFLDVAKAVTGSDRQTAKRLGVTPQHISQARKTGAFSNPMAIQLAEIIKVDPIRIIAAAEFQKAKTEDERNLWSRWVAAGGGVILSVLLLGGTFAPSSTYAAILDQPSIHYTQSLLLMFAALWTLQRKEKQQK